MEISPKYTMELITKVEEAIWEFFESYKNVRQYIDKWHQENGFDENFHIYNREGEGNIDLSKTLNDIAKVDPELLLKIAVDMDVETPNFIPAIPLIKNQIKAIGENPFKSFEKAFKEVESDPDTAIGMAGAALESIIKAIIEDADLKIEKTKKKSLYSLSIAILKEFKLYPNGEMVDEIRNLGSGLLNAMKAIDDLRGDKTKFHGKTDNDYLVEDPIYSYFVVNSVATIGLFLKSFYETKYKKSLEKEVEMSPDDLPF